MKTDVDIALKTQQINDLNIEIVRITQMLSETSGEKESIINDLKKQINDLASSVLAPEDLKFLTDPEILKGVPLFLKSSRGKEAMSLLMGEYRNGKIYNIIAYGASIIIIIITIIMLITMIIPGLNT